MDKYQVRIIDIIDVAKGTKTYILEKPEALSWQEGAHTHIAHLGFDQGGLVDKNLVRHMSISSLPEEGTVAFTTRVPGSKSVFKQRLSALTVGDELVLFKIGSRMALSREERPAVLLSMGVGIATMRPLVKRFVSDRRGITKLININVDRTGDFVFREEMDLEENGDCKSYWMTSREEYYEALSSTTTINGMYWVVGSDSFIIDTVSKLMHAGVAFTDIIIDKKDEKIQTLFQDV